MQDDALTECPECGGELRKIFAPPAIAFKGSGFYATDHGKKPPASSEGGEQKSEGTKGKGEKPSTGERGGNEGKTTTPGTSGTAAEAGSSGTASTTKETTPP